MRSPEGILEELTFMHDKLGVSFVKFNDILFTANRARAERVFELLIQEKLPIRFAFKARAPDVADDFVPLAKQAGAVQIGISVESADQDIVERVNKKTTVAQCARGIETVRRRGVRRHTGHVLGYAGEAPDRLCGAPRRRQRQRTAALPGPQRRRRRGAALDLKRFVHPPGTSEPRPRVSNCPIRVGPAKLITRTALNAICWALASVGPITGCSEQLVQGLDAPRIDVVTHQDTSLDSDAPSGKDNPGPPPEAPPIADRARVLEVQALDCTSNVGTPPAPLELHPYPRGLALDPSRAGAMDFDGDGVREGLNSGWGLSPTPGQFDADPAEEVARFHCDEKTFPTPWEPCEPYVEILGGNRRWDCTWATWAPAEPLCPVGLDLAWGDLDGDGAREIVGRAGVEWDYEPGVEVPLTPFDWGDLDPNSLRGDVILVDVDADGLTDVLTGGYWFRQREPREFELPTSMILPDPITSCIVDRDPDMAGRALCSTPYGVYQFPGGDLVSGVEWRTGGTIAGQSDLDGDGARDLVLLLPEYRVGIALGDATGGYDSVVEAEMYVHAYWPPDVTVGDFTHDGREDVLAQATYEGEDVGALLPAAPTPATPRVLEVEAAGALRGIWVTSGDFDGDGLDELLYGGKSWLAVMHEPPAEGSLVTLFGEPDADRTSFFSFGLHTTSPDGGWTGLPGDVNGDGNLDIVAVFRTWGADSEPPTSAGSPRVFLGDGSGALVEDQTIQRYSPLTWASRYVSKMYDADGDGDHEFLTLSGPSAQLGDATRDAIFKDVRFPWIPKSQSPYGDYFDPACRDRIAQCTTIHGDTVVSVVARNEDGTWRKQGVVGPLGQPDSKNSLGDACPIGWNVIESFAVANVVGDVHPDLVVVLSRFDVRTDERTYSNPELDLSCLTTAEPVPFRVGSWLAAVEGTETGWSGPLWAGPRFPVTEIHPGPITSSGHQMVVSALVDIDPSEWRQGAENLCTLRTPLRQPACSTAESDVRFTRADLDGDGSAENVSLFLLWPADASRYQLYSSALALIPEDQPCSETSLQQGTSQLVVRGEDGELLFHEFLGLRAHSLTAAQLDSDAGLELVIVTEKGLVTYQAASESKR
ncbi:MAG: VCBS repeat-containing protein [Myxococcales bacterium]|nr:VCBS repeat-containing protein [Myxococcales bacterium]